MVVSAVYVDSDDVLGWVFSSRVLSAGENCLQLLADDRLGGGMQPPYAIEQIDEHTILAGYAGAVFNDGGDWQIVDIPEGIVFVDGTPIVPESVGAGKMKSEK